VAGVHRRFQFAQQHRLQSAGELELHESLLQEEGHVVTPLGSLGGGQHDQSVGGPRPHLQLDVHRQDGVQGLVGPDVLVDAVRHVGVAGEGGIPDDNGQLAQRTLAVKAANTLKKRITKGLNSYLPGQRYIFSFKLILLYFFYFKV